MSRNILEICVDSTASALAARSGGADRLELCADLSIGGTTPSLALVKQVKAETGLPVRVNVSTSDLYDPVMMLSEQIGTAAHQVLEKTPPELAGDIYKNGVMLTGGGAQLHGLPEYLSQELKVDVYVSLGTAMSLSMGDKLEVGFTDATPRIGRR